MTAGQYLTRAHSHIMQAVAAMDGCFTLTGAHQQGKAIESMNRENPCLKTVYCRYCVVKHQLHTKHVAAVGWEPHDSSPMTCAGKVDHELPVN